MKTLKNQSVLIIGGTSGMGLGAAEAARDAGASVVIAGTNQEKTERIAVALGDGVTGKTVDVKKPESLQALIRSLDRLDHLFFTAAPGKTGAFREQTLDDARRYLDGHFWGSYVAAREASDRMSNGGSITFLSGGYTRRPQPGRTIVAVSQAAVEGLARALAVELSPIRVNVIVPGLIDTPLWDDMPKKTKQDFFKAEAQRLPAKRVGQPNDIGSAFVYLAGNTFVTGTTLEVNGGWSLV